MDITFKNLEYQLQDGEQFPSFKAVLCINNKVVGKCWNDGYGAVTRYEANDEASLKLIKAAEADCLEVPIVFKGHEGYDEFWLSRTLSLEIDQKIMGIMFRHEIADPDLKDRHDEIRDKRIDMNNTDVAPETQMARDMQKGFLIGEPKDYIVYEYGISLARILDNPDAEEILVPELMKISRRFKGNQILNTNIPDKFLERAGIGKEQFPEIKKEFPKPARKQHPGKRKGIK